MTTGKTPGHRRRVGLTLLVLAACSSCSRNIGEPPADHRPPALLTVHVSAPSGAALPAAAILYVGARVPGGPLLYVARLENPNLPVSVPLSEEQRMMNDAAPPPSVMQAFARIDTDGDAGTLTEGDWVGVADGAPLGGEISVELQPYAPPAPVRYEIEVRGQAALPRNATMFTIVRPTDQRVPVAATRAPVPATLPAVVTLSEADLMGRGIEQGKAYTVIVKIDQDGNPLTTTPGDLEGEAPLDGGRTIVTVGEP